MLSLDGIQRMTIVDASQRVWWCSYELPSSDFAYGYVTLVCVFCVPEGCADGDCCDAIPEVGMTGLEFLEAIQSGQLVVVGETC